MLQNGRTDEAFDIIRRIHGEGAQAEFTQMCRQAEVERAYQQSTSTFKQLRQPHNLKRIALGFALMFGGQTTGTLVLNSMHPHTIESLLRRLSLWHSLTLIPRLWCVAIHQAGIFWPVCDCSHRRMGHGIYTRQPLSRLFR